MSKLDVMVKKFKAGKIAPHVYVSDGASRDPECNVRGCKWCWANHLDSTLLAIVKEAAKEKEIDAVVERT